MKEYKKIVEKYNGTTVELAEDIGNLHYEELMIFLAHLARKMFNDSKKDTKNDRPELGKVLMGAFNNIDSARYEIEKAWKISKPHMTEEKVKEKTTYDSKDLKEDLEKILSNFDTIMDIEGKLKENGKDFLDSNEFFKKIIKKIKNKK